MDKKKLHINEAGDKSYPDPDVPVQAAWENMQQLLLQAPAVPAKAIGFKKWLGKGIGKIVLGAGVVATVSVITVVVIKKEQKPAIPVTYNRDSISASQPVVAKDTIPPVTKEKCASFEFHNVPLKLVAVDMEKGYGVKIILKGDVGERRISVKADRITLEQMLKLIAITLECKYKIDEGNKQVTITGNGSDK